MKKLAVIGFIMIMVFSCTPRNKVQKSPIETPTSVHTDIPQGEKPKKFIPKPPPTKTVEATKPAPKSEKTNTKIPEMVSPPKRPTPSVKIPPKTKPTPPPPPTKPKMTRLQMGAEKLNQYLPILSGSRVALVVNQTSTIGSQHLVDVLLAQGVAVKKVFAPEHGFRGTADAGEKVNNSRDSRTGLPIVSLYGKSKKPSPEHLAGIDLVIFDIQDVGARFYTYISTMHYVMEACAEQGKKMVVLDRPNPNGHYVDGPILEPAYKSFVGMHPIPVVHGMTVGELARMINGERWLKNGVRCDLTVVPCDAYTHRTIYHLPIKPSPNLPNSRSIYLYPSLCFFEGTAISVGRGTDKQFQLIGAPQLSAQRMPYQFTPVSKAGAKYPKHQNKTCNGFDLSMMRLESFYGQNQLDLKWLIQVYQDFPNKSAFFNKNNFFDKLAGTAQLRQQIIAGTPEHQIRASWEPALSQFKAKRNQYLLYPDF